MKYCQKMNTVSFNKQNQDNGPRSSLDNPIKKFLFLILFKSVNLFAKYAIPLKCYKYSFFLFCSLMARRSIVSRVNKNSRDTLRHSAKNNDVRQWSTQSKSYSMADFNYRISNSVGKHFRYGQHFKLHRRHQTWERFLQSKIAFIVVLWRSLFCFTSNCVLYSCYFVSLSLPLHLSGLSKSLYVNLLESLADY